jgi:hypothetical protein
VACDENVIGHFRAFTLFLLAGGENVRIFGGCRIATEGHQRVPARAKRSIMAPSTTHAPTATRMISPRYRFAVLLSALACAPALAAQPPTAARFEGRWLPDVAPDAQATVAGFAIKGAKIAWTGARKPAPKCVQPFVLKPEVPGTQYTDGRGTRFIAGVAGSLPTYLLALNPSTCGSGADTARISFPLVYDRDHIELIEYAGGKPVSARRFHRSK